jgi:hypothetical protein
VPGAAAPGSGRGGKTDCKRCEFCHTRQYGCTNSSCYCHTHPLEPVPVTVLHDPLDQECLWYSPGHKNRKPTTGNCEICRAKNAPNWME